MSEIRIDSLAIEIETKSEKSASGIDTLIGKLQNLNNVVTTNLNSLGKLSNALSDIQKSSQLIKDVDLKIKDSKPMQTVAQQPTATKLPVDNIKAPMGSSDGGNQTVANVDKITNALERASNATDEGKTRLHSYRETLKEIDGTKFSNIQAQLDAISQRAKDAANEIKSAYTIISNTSDIGGKKVTSTVTQDTKGVQTFDVKVKGTGELSATKKLFDALSASINKSKLYLNELGSVTGGVMRAMGNNVKQAGSAVINSFNSIKKNASQMNKGITDSFKHMLKTAGQLSIALLGVRGVFTSLRKAVSMYMSYDDELNKQLQNDWAVLGSLLAPILEKVVELFTRLTAYINAFVRALTGIDLVARANAKSLNSAAKGAKAYRNELGNLQKFDDLNVVNFDKDSGSGTDAKTPLTVAGVDTSWMDAFIEKIKINDWYGLGMEISRNFNDGLRAIDFDWLIKEAAQWGKNFGDLSNGLIDGADWDLIGQKVADGFNTAFAFVNTFFDTFHFEDFGKDLGNGINSAIQSINWGELGQFLSNDIEALIEGVAGFLSTFDFASFGVGLATTLVSWVDNIDWELALTNIGEGFVGLFEGIQGFITSTDWGKLAKNLATELTNGFTNISKEIQNFNWDTFGDDIYKAIKDIITNVDWAGLVSAMASAFGAAFGGIVGLLGAIIGDAFVDIKNYFQPFIDEFGDTGLDIVAGILKGILQGIVNIGVWIYDNMLKPFVDGFKSAFGIHSPSKVMIDLAGYIIDGFVEGIKGIWDAVKNIIGGLVSSVSNAFSSIWNKIKEIFSFKTVKDFFGKVVDTMKNVFTSIPDWFKNIFTKAWTGVKDVFSTGGKIFTGLTEGILESFKKIVNKIIDGINKVVKIPFDGINKMLNKIRNVEILGVSPFKGLWNQDPIGVPQIPKLATGTNRIEAEGLYHLHQGEAVVPKKYNPAVNNRLYEEKNDRIVERLDTLIDTIDNQESTTIVNVDGKETANETRRKSRRRTNIYGKPIQA